MCARKSNSCLAGNGGTDPFGPPYYSYEIANILNSLISILINFVIDMSFKVVMLHPQDRVISRFR